MAKQKISIDDLQTRQRSKLTPLMRINIAILVLLAVVASAAAIALLVGGSEDSSPQSEQIVRSLSAKSVDEDREDAIAAAEALLNATNAPATITEAGDAIGELEDGDFSSFAPDFTERVRYYDAYESNVDFQTEVAMSIYSIAALAKESNGGEIAGDRSRSGTVRVDQETGIAQVPIDLFTGNESPVAFQMIYVDGEWKLEPHSFSSYIRLSALLRANPSAG